MITAVGVIVPAANEQELIGDCLDALWQAAAHLRLRRDVEIRMLVVLDSCADATARLAARAGVDTLAGDFGAVGVARAAGSSLLLRDTMRPRGEVWLANTDADSRVSPDWLSHMVELADRGADVVLGTVLPSPGLSAVVEGRWRRRHSLAEGHPHVHGANFGIRADAYLALGGWPALPTDEDVVLARRAVAAGHLRVARTATSPVRTSVRTRGRAPGGFAGHMRALAASE